MNNHACQVRYSRATVETFLPAVWDQDFILKPPKNVIPLGVRIKSRPAEAMNEWQLGVADVCLAYYRADLSLDERTVLRWRDRGMSYSSLATYLSQPVDVVTALEAGAIRKITDWLNGERG